MTKPYSLFSPENPRLVTRKGLQFIARIGLRGGAGGLGLIGMVLAQLAQSRLLEGGDILNGDCNGCGLSAKHFERRFEGMYNLSV